MQAARSGKRLPNKRHKPFRARAVAAVRVRKSCTQVSLFDVGAVDEKRSCTKEYDEPERTIRERGAEEGEENTGVDGVAHELIRPARHKLMVSSQRLRHTPVAPKIHTRPNGERDPDESERCANPRPE
jgi:hypothetical protein